MTVRELIRLLASYPSDMKVVVNGYEGGYDDLSPEQISVMPIRLNTGGKDWEGCHGDVFARGQGPGLAPYIKLTVTGHNNHD